MSRISPFFFTLLTSLPLIAAEPAGGKAEHDVTPWLWANFVILAGALFYLARKHGGPYLKARDESIRKGIADAGEKKADAERRVAEVNQRLSNLDAEIAELKVQMHNEQQQEAKRLEDRNTAEIARVQQQATQEIESAGKAARLELQAQAARLALDLAEQKLRTQVNDEAQHRLTSGFVESLR